MILKKNNPKIATILPYKESYTLEHASAVSLWVSEFFNQSSLKNNNYIYGNANSKNYLTKNYINIPLKNLRLKFRSTSNEYIEKLSKKLIDEKFDIVEIHNRPSYLKYFLYFKKKIVFYFHNDPLTMAGSISINDRIFILNNCHKIILSHLFNKNNLS